MNLLKKTTAIILAGGSGSRMSFDKTRIMIHGKNILQHHYDIFSSCFGEVIISVGKGNAFYISGYPNVVEDDLPGKGPIMGIYSAMRESKNNLNFVIAVDIPFVNFKVIEKLISKSRDYDIVVPSFNKDQCDTLFAVYRKNILTKMDRQIQKNQLKITDLFPLCKACVVNISDKAWYSNLNTPEDVSQYLKKRE